MALLALMGTSSCGEGTWVAVVNETDQRLEQISWGDCLWEESLLPGERTRGCAPTVLQGRVRFEIVRPVDLEGDTRRVHIPYRTRQELEVEPGEARLLTVRPPDLEEDYDRPSPFAH